jgi:hypothetical protein
VASHDASRAGVAAGLPVLGKAGAAHDSERAGERFRERVERQLLREIKDTPKEYLPNPLRIVRVFRESVALKPARDSFRQEWKEAMRGETRPVSDLWEDIAAE